MVFPTQLTYLVAIFQREILPSYRNVDSVEKCWWSPPTAPHAPAGAERSPGAAPCPCPGLPSLPSHPEGPNYLCNQIESYIYYAYWGMTTGLLIIVHC